MFFKTKRNRRKTTRQTLSTEQLEPKAMFSVSPVEPVVALDVGPVNQAGYDCTNAGTCSGIWTNGGASTLRIGGNSGPGGTSFMTGEDGYTHCMHELHFQGFTTGAGGDSIVHPQFSGAVNSLAVANHSPSLIGDSDRPGDVGTSFEGRTTSDHDLNDITLHASANPHAGPEGFMKLGDIKGEFQLTQRLGGSASPGGDDVFMPKPDSRGLSLHDSVHCVSGSPAGSGRVGVWTNGNATSIRARQDMELPGAGAEGFIKLGDIKGEFQLTQRIVSSANTGSDDIFMPKPLNVSMYDHMEAPVGSVSMHDHVKAPRYQAFALMGR